MIFCLIWLLSYEGSISNPFQVWRNIVSGIAFILVLYQRHKLSSGGSGCTLRTIVLCQRSLKNKHPMPSNSFELAVALLFWSSAMLGVIKTFEQPLKLWFFHLLMIFSFWGCSFWWGASDELASDVITSGGLDFRSTFFRCFKLPLLCWFHCSHLFFKNLYFKIDTTFLSMVLHTWTNISTSNWQFLIPCYHQNLRVYVKYILFQHTILHAKGKLEWYNTCICIEFDMFIESELINAYHLFLRDILALSEFKNFFLLDKV